MRKTEELINKWEKLEKEILNIKKEAFKEITKDNLFEFLNIDVKGCMIGYNGKVYYVEENSYEWDTERGRYGEIFRDFNTPNVDSVRLTEKYLFIETPEYSTRIGTYQTDTYKISRTKPQLRHIPQDMIVLISDIITYCIEEITKEINDYTPEPDEKYRELKEWIEKELK